MNENIESRNHALEIAKGSYDMYASRLAIINADFPQHQGMQEHEFIAAFNNPQVIKTEIIVGNDKCKIPQLEPVTAFEWLHAPFYQEHFPDEFADGDLMHFTDIPGIEPGDEVKARLAQLAEKKGVLVFDYPSSDSEYPKRVHELLKTIGIGIDTTEVLGEQTYFAGNLVLRRPNMKQTTPLQYPEAFDELVKSGQFNHEELENGTSLQRTIEGEEAETMYGFYKEAYKKISNDPCVQGLDPEEFREMLSNPKISKVVYRKNGKAQSLCLVTNDLSKLTWINPQYYQKHYPKEYDEGRVVWYPGIATDPDPSVTGRSAPKLVKLMTKLNEIGNNPSIVVFDTPKMNTGFLDAYLEALINQGDDANIKFDTLGVQQYCAAKLYKQPS